VSDPQKVGFKKLLDQDCQIVLGAGYQNWKKVPNEHKMYQMLIKSQMSIK
jgi:hypothetical protein